MNGPDPARATTSGGVASAWSRMRSWLAAGPAYPANAGDLRSVSMLGLDLPIRATVAVVAVSLLLLLDYHGRINGLVETVLGPPGPGAADAKRLESIGRLIVQGAVPLLLVLFVLRDRPGRYGLRVGDWRAGLAIALAGCAVMTPIVLVLARMEVFTAYYGPQGAAGPVDVLLTTALEVIPAEFFYRGFLLFALLRVVGPLAVVIATLPFAFAHLGKPEVETLSTLIGGLLYGWLDWRTGSVLWSGLAHTWILSLVVIAAAAMGAPAP